MTTQQRIAGMVVRLLADHGLEKTETDIPPTALLYGTGGIGLDSLDMAVLSSYLEREFGSDPFSSGQFPRTLAEIVHFYEAAR